MGVELLKAGYTCGRLVLHHVFVGPMGQAANAFRGEKLKDYGG